MPSLVPTQRRLVYTLLICVPLGFTCAMHAFDSPQAEVTFGAGEKLWLRLDTTISSNTTQVGDHVEAKLQSPQVTQGARVLGTVTAARAADKPHRIQPRLKLVFSQIVLTDGRTIPMEGTIELNGLVPTISRKAAASTGALGMGSLGALVGGLSNGGKGAGIGAAVGAGVGVLSMGLMPMGVWKDVSIKRGRPFAVELKQDVRLPIVPVSKP